MILKLAYYGDPILRKKSSKVEQIDDDIRELAANMIETMHSARGIGLAAPQVYRSLSLFVSAIPYKDEQEKWIHGENRVFINPKILSYSETFEITSEGCLSIPKLYVDIARPSTIEIQATDLSGNIFTATMTGLEAVNFMHENDHLNGVLIIDRMDRKERAKIEALLKQIKKKYSQMP